MKEVFSRCCQKCENIMNICPIEIYNEPLEFDKEVRCPLWMLYNDFEKPLREAIKEEENDS